MPDNFESGVQLNPPPPSLREAVDASIMHTIGQLQPGSKGALIGVVQRVNGKQSVNLAVVHREGEHWVIGAYVAKRWNEPVEYGGIVRAEW
jgi:hypothetical protein